MFGQLHRVFADKNVRFTDPGIQTYARGSNGIYQWPGDSGFLALSGDIDQRIDAALGIGTEYPEPGLSGGTADIFFVQLGINDVRALDYYGIQPGDEQLLINTYRAGLDRIIASGAEMVYLISCHKIYNNITRRPEQVAIEETKLVNSVIKSFDGYKGRCIYVDINTGYGPEYTFDGLHFNLLGMRWFADRVAESIPDARGTTFAWSLQEEEDETATNTGNSGVFFSGEWSGTTDWTDYPDNDRRYPMTDSTGNTFKEQVGGYDATIINFDEANWG